MTARAESTVQWRVQYSGMYQVCCVRYRGTRSYPHSSQHSFHVHQLVDSLTYTYNTPHVARGPDTSHHQGFIHSIQLRSFNSKPITILHSQDSFTVTRSRQSKPVVALVDDCGSLNYTSSLVSATSRSLLIKARPDSHRGGWAGTHLSLMSVKLKRASIARRAAVRNRVKIHDGLRSRKSSIPAQSVSHRVPT